MVKPTTVPDAGSDAIASKGWWSAHKWLVLRRLTQFGILALFLVGPLAGIWIVKGNLNFSYTLGVLPLTDLFVGMQTLATGHLPEKLGLIGLGVVLAFYLLVGGRTYCAWVCPINPVTDAAHWLRTRLGIQTSAHVSSKTRYWLLGMALLLSAVTGSLAWELINPISMLHRGLIFGMGAAWMIVLSVFLFDLFVVKRGWCGHLCPTGAAYSLLGRTSVVRVTAAKREACNDCMDCYQVCPEPKVIRPALKGAAKGLGPVILSEQCTNCGRCIDVCAKDVFSFGTRFQNPASLPTAIQSTS
ncbi:quinol dehydrogenase ferredoxin subunit NapH [Rhodoferax sp.]|uniref:quinol dehydrogenase ferredoxin subunit NapH n=1 Tax=Rhodoferax sp. TaxID=50421 RepID=UPI00276FD0DB|nr:quinol dehydrogenase ferredoxin subunit NapH [Rhodoferax sp.]